MYITKDNDKMNDKQRCCLAMESLAVDSSQFIQLNAREHFPIYLVVGVSSAAVWRSQWEPEGARWLRWLLLVARPARPAIDLSPSYL